MKPVMLDELDVPFDEALCWALASWTLQDRAAVWAKYPALKAAQAIKLEIGNRWKARARQRQHQRRVALVLLPSRGAA